MSEKDQAARFEAIALPHLGAAYNLARWLVRNEQDADDIVQEAYMRAFKFFAGFHGTSGRAWLLAIVRNTTYTWLKENSDRAMMTEFDDELHSLGDGVGAPAADSPSNNPEAVLMRGDEQRQLNQALEQLPVEFREVLVLRELEDLSYKEIADIAGIPIGTVMSRLARARKLLAEILQGKKAPRVATGAKA